LQHEKRSDDEVGIAETLCLPTKAESCQTRTAPNFESPSRDKTPAGLGGAGEGIGKDGARPGIARVSLQGPTSNQTPQSGSGKTILWAMQNELHATPSACHFPSRRPRNFTPQTEDSPGFGAA
jgi:hypothetical protein